MSLGHEHPSQNTPDIVDVIADMRKTVPYEYGSGAEGDHREKIVQALDAIGVQGSDQSEDTIELNIYNARALVENGDAWLVLKKHPFVDEETFKRNRPEDQQTPVSVVDFPEPIPINWSRLDGASSFHSWLGRGANGTGKVSHRKLNTNRTSIEAIFDYATRDTPLPSVDLQLYLTDDKAYLFAENSHTAAAAILRQENLKCKWLQIIDARTRKSNTDSFESDIKE